MEKITVIASTNRNDSVSNQVAQLYQKMLNEKGVESNLINLGDLPSDFAFSALYENAGKNDGFNQFRSMMAESEKFVFIVPEYNGSFPGVLKTFIDGLQFPDTFTDKKCALVGISSGVQGAGLALSHLTDIFNYCGTQVLAQKPKLARIENNFENGKITNPLYAELLDDQVNRLIIF